jgi:hypothetical protein
MSAKKKTTSKAKPGNSPDSVWRIAGHPTSNPLPGVGIGRLATGVEDHSENEFAARVGILGGDDVGNGHSLLYFRSAMSR